MLRPRLIGYFAALLAMFAAFSYTIASRVPLEIDILRDRGQLYTTTPEGMIENVYTLKLANKEQRPHTYKISVSGPEGLEMVDNGEVIIEAGELLNFPVRLHLDPKQLTSANSDIEFTIQALDNPSISVTEPNRFNGPAPKR